MLRLDFTETVIQKKSKQVILNVLSQILLICSLKDLYKAVLLFNNVRPFNSA